MSLTKADVSLGNVDNTSDATKNSASATLTNKTISGADNTLANIPQSAITNLSTDLTAKAADNAVVKLTGTQTITGAKTFSGTNTSVAITNTSATAWSYSAFSLRNTAANNGLQVSAAFDGSNNPHGYIEFTDGAGTSTHELMGFDTGQST